MCVDSIISHSPAGLSVGTKSSLVSRTHWSFRSTLTHTVTVCVWVCVFYDQALLLDILFTSGERLPCSKCFQMFSPVMSRVNIEWGFRGSLYSQWSPHVWANTSPLCPFSACRNTLSRFLSPSLQMYQCNTTWYWSQNSTCLDTLLVKLNVQFFSEPSFLNVAKQTRWVSVLS